MNNPIQCTLQMNKYIDTKQLMLYITSDKSFVFCLSDCLVDNKPLTLLMVESITHLLQHWNNNYSDVTMELLSNVITTVKQQYCYTREHLPDGTSNWYVEKL